MSNNVTQVSSGIEKRSSGGQKKAPGQGREMRVVFGRSAEDEAVERRIFMKVSERMQNRR